MRYKRRTHVSVRLWPLYVCIRTYTHALLCISLYFSFFNHIFDRLHKMSTSCSLFYISLHILYLFVLDTCAFIRIDLCVCVYKPLYTPKRHNNLYCTSLVSSVCMFAANTQFLEFAVCAIHGIKSYAIGSRLPKEGADYSNSSRHFPRRKGEANELVYTYRSTRETGVITVFEPACV